MIQSSILNFCLYNFFILTRPLCGENLVHAIISTHNVESKNTAASAAATTADSLQDDAELDELEN